MTRQEEIRQEALKAEKEVSPRCAGDKENIFHGVNSAYDLGFVDGALWADTNPKLHWISVKESLPFEHEELIRKHCVFKPETIYVFVKKHDNTFGVDYMLFDNEKWKWMRNFGITHWMIIPELPK